MHRVVTFNESEEFGEQESTIQNDFFSPNEIDFVTVLANKMNKRLSIATEKLGFLKSLNSETTKHLEELEFDEYDLRAILM